MPQREESREVRRGRDKRRTEAGRDRGRRGVTRPPREDIQGHGGEQEKEGRGAKMRMRKSSFPPG